MGRACRAGPKHIIFGLAQQARHDLLFFVPEPTQTDAYVELGLRVRPSGGTGTACLRNNINIILNHIGARQRSRSNGK
jgi:hypothetical protein